MRLSSTQKDVLFILYAIEAGGKAEPVPGVKILEMINSARQSGIHGTNFRTSCHTLVENGLLNKYRNASLKLAFRLTDDGRERAGRDIPKTAGRRAREVIRPITGRIELNGKAVVGAVRKFNIEA